MGQTLSPASAALSLNAALLQGRGREGEEVAGIAVWVNQSDFAKRTRALMYRKQSNAGPCGQPQQSAGVVTAGTVQLVICNCTAMVSGLRQSSLPQWSQVHDVPLKGWSLALVICHAFLLAIRSQAEGWESVPVYQDMSPGSAVLHSKWRQGKFLTDPCRKPAPHLGSWDSNNLLITDTPIINGDASTHPLSPLATSIHTTGRLALP